MGLGQGRLYGSIQQNKLETGAKGNGFALAYAYPLSKRTSLYTSYATLRNNASGQFRIESSGDKALAGGVGADPSVFTVGMRHLF